MVRIGVWMPTRGPLSIDPGIGAIAGNVEAAGFDSLMIPDHVVMPTETRSWYPFSSDGVPSWDVKTPWNDAIVAMALSAAATERVTIGTGILVLPQRNPVVLAKQLATLDVHSKGRVMLGVGAGWLGEEFEALGVDFATRGARMDESLELMREMWTGEPRPFRGEHFTLPDGVLAYPTPTRHIPIVVGGMSKAALRRAADADGWFSIQRMDALDVDEIARGVEAIRERRGDREPPQVLLRAMGDVEVLLPKVAAFMAVGVTEFVIDADLTDVELSRRAQERVRDAAG